MVPSINFRLGFLLICVFGTVRSFSGARRGGGGPSIRPTSREALSVHNSQHDQNSEKQLQRRQVLSQAANLLLLPSVMTQLPQVSDAAAPVTLKDTDSLAAIAKRKLRPKPPKILRRKLSIDFAVLLMRSSYNSLDSLDCVAMDQFQRDFFLIRSSDYKPYTESLGPGMVQQGDLADPYYFDFISFAQYTTMNREITVNPVTVFEEQQPKDQGEDKPMDFVSVVVKRDPSLTDAMLAPEHSRRVGVLVLDKLEETFRGTASAVPSIENGSKPDSARLLASLKQLINQFLINGYAFDANVSIEKEGKSTDNAKGTKFSIRLDAPANIWGGKVLQAEGAALTNSFVTKVAAEFINRAGYIVSSNLKYEGTTENISITIL